MLCISFMCVRNYRFSIGNEIRLRRECVWLKIARYLDGDEDIEDIVGQWDAAITVATIARFKTANKSSGTERVRVSK